MAWIYIFAARFVEIAFALCLKQSDGFTRLWASVGTVTFGGISLVLLSLALRQLPVGSAYAIWTGIGAAGTAIAGVVLLGESGNALKVASITAIIAGVIGLRLAGAE
jgi:quaternary ammonium compound-resistance protein SugE